MIVITCHGIRIQNVKIEDNIRTPLKNRRLDFSEIFTFLKRNSMLFYKEV